MPGKPAIFDTLGTRTYFFQAGNAVYFCNISPDPNPGRISSASALEVKYDSVLVSIYPRLGRYQPKTSEKIIFKGLKALHFTALTDAYSQYNYFETYSVFVGNELFQFNVLTKAPIQEDSQKFYDSIIFNENVSGDNQGDELFIKDKKPGSRFLIYILGSVVAIGLLIFLARKRNER